ncbi:MAG TPA: hypothetical protein VFJ84_02645 [Candidatus Saccharimonadales bacterium]|nr:hypothetical protein [Candidatus Saccharimonadales bacterium]
MPEQKVKQSFIASVILTVLALIINVWEQATTGQVNGSIQWAVLPIAGVAMLFTYIIAKYASRKGADTKWVGRSLLLMIALSLIIIQVSTRMWGFAPQGWTF